MKSGAAQENVLSRLNRTTATSRNFSSVESHSSEIAGVSDMTGLKRYRNLVFDNSRWTGFRFRDGDIVISTPPKCGTTWMQTLCAMFVFGTPQRGPGG